MQNYEGKKETLIFRHSVHVSGKIDGRTKDCI
jgi:hypothetical protein